MLVRPETDAATGWVPEEVVGLLSPGRATSHTTNATTTATAMAATTRRRVDLRGLDAEASIISLTGSWVGAGCMCPYRRLAPALERCPDLDGAKAPKKVLSQAPELWTNDLDGITRKRRAGGKPALRITAPGLVSPVRPLARPGCRGKRISK